MPTLTNNDGKAPVLMIYTGGTIGMVEDPATGSLEPFNFQHLSDHVPELKGMGHIVDTIQFDLFALNYSPSYLRLLNCKSCMNQSLEK